jgi:hypothetical protein
MKRLALFKFEKSKKPKSPAITGTLGSSHESERAPSTSTIVTTTGDPMLTATAQIVHGAGVTVSVQLASEWQYIIVVDQTAHNRVSTPVQVVASSLNDCAPQAESVQAELGVSTPVSINHLVSVSVQLSPPH